MEKYTFSEILKEANGLVRNWNLSKEMTTFREALKKNILDFEETTILIEELNFFHSYSINSISSMLHSSINYDVMFNLSSHFVSISKIKFNDTNSQLPLPSNEAISNHFLSLAETDLTEFLVANYVIPSHFWNIDLFSDYIENNNQIFPDSVQKYLGELVKLKALIDKSAVHYEHISINETNRRKILSNIFIMLETVDCFYKEIFHGYKKWDGNVYIA